VITINSYVLTADTVRVKAFIVGTCFDLFTVPHQATYIWYMSHKKKCVQCISE